MAKVKITSNKKHGCHTALFQGSARNHASAPGSFFPEMHNLDEIVRQVR
jgi:hypothetical protein